MQVPIGEEMEAIGKDQYLLEMVAYRDMWGKGRDSYLHMIYQERELVDREVARQAMTDWILGLRRIWRA